MASVLIIEDDPTLYQPVKDWLILENYIVEIQESAESALNALATSDFELMVVDVILPGITGYEFCKSYRARGGKARILIVSGKSETDDKLAGLSAGADDYIAKPFDVREVVARLKVLSRRSLQLAHEPLEFEDVSVDVSAHKAYRAGAELNLGPMEFALLEFMIKQPNQVFSGDDLLRCVWEGKGSVDTVRTHIKTLRKKLELPGQIPLIRTIHGVGYCFTSEW